jgi:hypothetical protein
MSLNLLASLVVTFGIIAGGLIGPPIWERILSLSTPAVVLLGTVTCGIMLLFIPAKFWRMLKDRNTSGRALRTETREGPMSAPNGSSPVINKKAIKEAALKSRTQEFDL